MKRTLPFWLVLAASTALGNYAVKDGWIVAHDGTRFNNRPLYCDNTGAFVLAGDRPFLRFAQGRRIYGGFLAAIVRGGEEKWLHDCSGVTSAYRAGGMKWEVRDPAFAGLTVTLHALPITGGTGLVVRAAFDGARAGDRLVWAFGGASPHTGAMPEAAWDLDVLLHPEWTTRGFDPAACSNNTVHVQGGHFELRAGTAGWPALVGQCDAGGEPVAADASAWTSPAKLPGTKPGALPLVCGEVPMDIGREVHLAIEVAGAPTREPAVAFKEGERRVEGFAQRAAVETPDACLNAIAPAAAAAVDGTWIAPVFVHGGMAWNRPYPGWRTVFGGTVFGWHERVLQQARHYIASQNREPPGRQPKSDPAYLLTKEHKESRYFGRGRITHPQHGVYNMQSQFFDQLVHAWRWTGDAELEALLRPALELHLEWARECFDPDGDGCYESYINVWPTDSVWYNGGGGVEESMYAWRGHEAARDMALRAGDAEAAAGHAAALERIRGGFFGKLWVPGKGHPGLYVEQGGHRRLLENAWLYSIFMPVDAGILTPVQAASSLHYTDWALQNDTLPEGGRGVWTSNFVPGIWSVRELWPGDNYHLALAYFRTGLAGPGWEVFRGNFLHSAFRLGIPGNLGYPRGGTDFGDCVHTFSRTLVEGLFGLRPDYPKGVVRIAPQFPESWEHAAIRTPDFSLRFARTGDVTRLEAGLARPCALEVELPVRARRVAGVSVGGQPAAHEVLPGFGCSVVRVRVPAGEGTAIEVTAEGPLPAHGPETVRGKAGGALALRAAGASATAFEDPQGALGGTRIEEGEIRGTLAGRAGHYTVLATVDAGGAPQWRLFQMEITDPAAEAAERAGRVGEIPRDARWKCVDLGGAFNADVREIYRQRYVSPRPDTVSVRIGTDGYSPWTFLHWKSSPPAIGLDRVPGMLDAAGRLATPQGVPFLWTGGARNIAFTSLWDNYPPEVSVPVSQSAEAAWFLVCGSTTVMQARIANAVLRLRYADGVEDRVELVPPFNYWNLSPITANARAPGQSARSDYTDPDDAFAVPEPWPERVQLGENCRALLLSHRLRRGVVLERVTLETLSQDVVAGLMGLTLMNPEGASAAENAPGGAL